MNFLVISFWIFLFLLFYSYLGYGILLRGLLALKKRKENRGFAEEDLPEVTLLIAAYNEEDFIQQKIENSLDLDYPKGKLHWVFVTDGSNDNSPEVVGRYPQIRHYHQPERRGKLAAVHRVMPLIDTPIVVFSDANTLLNKQAIRNLVKPYADPQIGAVAGEKRVHMAEQDNASAAGEGLYWKYESKLKQWDGEWYSVVGAAGELFSVRRDAFREVPPDSLIEDFYLTMSIAQDGYRVAYVPEAYAVETASMTVKEEIKRKIRISAGAFQAMWRLRDLLNPIKYGKLSFQYISHRVLRWTLAPLGLGWLLIAAPILAWQLGGIYSLMAIGQIAFYLLAGLGWWMESREIRLKALFVPYYFVMMNVCIWLGWRRYRRGEQKVTWAKAQRKSYA